MKFNESWLREWVDPDISREELLEQFTMAGLEVENTAAVAGEFSGVVVGKVFKANKHPNADQLSLCEVTDGEQTYQVVCGAPNVRAGLVTAFARIGAVLPGNFKIKKAKLHKVESHGMLCSAGELGLGDDHEGILDLAEDLIPGVDLRQALELDDLMIDLDITPNRGDCLSLRGLAREVGVLNNQGVSAPEISVVEATLDDSFTVDLEDPVGCPRYLGRVIKGIDIKAASPFWLRERLRRGGLRSIDPVVDVTNFVMLELGQPMHAFDLQQLHNRIIVRKANEGEKLTLLDGQEISLDAQTLLITDDEGPIAIAGVMGGERSGVQADTRDVFLECAFFQPLTIAGTARRYGLQTDASQRYERGVDFELQSLATERATQLLLDIVGGAAGPVVESVESAALPVAAEVSVREHRLNDLLGITIDPREVDDVLDRLGFDLVGRDDAAAGVTWTIRVPSHRFDISQEADLVEEVCRIYGYNNIPVRTPTVDLSLPEVPIQRSSAAALKQQMVDLGYQEAITYSFIEPTLQDLLDPGVEPLALVNPMSAEQSVMRTNMLPGLLEVLRGNVARQQDRVRLFELGLCFVPGKTLDQRLILGGVIWGKRHLESWNQDPAMADFFDLKGDVERLLAWSGAADVSFERLADSVFHPGQAASVILDGTPIGRLGRLHPEVERRLDVPGEIFVLELAGEALLQHTKRVHGEVSKFPSVRRDLALLVARETPAAQIITILRQTLGDVLVDLRLFDLYQGKGIDLTEKSLGVGLTLQHPSATLTEEEIGHYMQNAVQALTQAVGAKLR